MKRVNSFKKVVGIKFNRGERRMRLKRSKTDVSNTKNIEDGVFKETPSDKKIKIEKKKSHAAKTRSETREQMVKE